MVTMVKIQSNPNKHKNKFIGFPERKKNATKIQACANKPRYIQIVLPMSYLKNWIAFCVKYLCSQSIFQHR